VQRCLNIATVVANECGPVMSPRTEKRLESPPCEQPLRKAELAVPLLVVKFGCDLAALASLLEKEEALKFGHDLAAHASLLGRGPENLVVKII
jgi:hypothetical protein